MIINIKGYSVEIDDNKYEQVSAYVWRISSKNGGIYFETGKRGEKRIYLHRMLINCADDKLCDHIDGNTLNCKIENLRECTKTESNRNRKAKGFYYKPGHKKPCACIGHNGRSIHLGYFYKEDDARAAYKEAAKKYFGEFARS